MHSKLITAAAAILVAGAIAACGSSSSSSSSASASSSSTTASTTSSASSTASSFTTKAAAPVHGHTTTHKLAGTTGRKLTVADIKHFKIPNRQHQHAHVAGLQGLGLSQKVNLLLSNLVPFWQKVFTASGGQLPAGNATLVDAQPFACGSSQVTSASPPGYCPGNDTLMFPLGSITANVAPLGDGAIFLMVADLYSYHVENALGAFGHGYSGTQLKLMDSCLSGIALGTFAGALNGADETSVNAYLAAEAQAFDTAAGSGGGVSAPDLSAALNKGLTSVIVGQTPKPGGCTPS